MNLANSITISRLLLIPVFGVTMVMGASRIALGIFAVAAFTDFLDGWVARKWDQETDLGAFLDPLADKLLLHVTFFALIYTQQIPYWPWVVLVARDVVLLGGLLVLRIALKRLNRAALKPTLLGKMTTAFHLVSLALLLVAMNIQWADLIAIARWTIYGVALVTGTNAVQYVVMGCRWLKAGRMEI